MLKTYTCEAGRKGYNSVVNIQFILFTAFFRSIDHKILVGAWLPSPYIVVHSFEKGCKYLIDTLKEVRHRAKVLVPSPTISPASFGRFSQ
jgi:hypothetical protein